MTTTSDMDTSGGTRRAAGRINPRLAAAALVRPTRPWPRGLSFQDIMWHSGMSKRTLLRRFPEQTGTTPLQWLRRAHVRQAQFVLETTAHPIDRIAGQVGFGSATTLRDRFKRVIGVSPHAYRNAIQEAAGPVPALTRRGG